MAGLIYLIDKSALAPRLGDDSRMRVASLVTGGRAAVCWISMLEILYSAVSAKHWREAHGDLSALRLLPTTDAAFQRAVEVQGLLARRDLIVKFFENKPEAVFDRPARN